MPSVVGMVGNFPTPQHNFHFKKSKTVLDESNTQYPTEPVGEPAGHPYLFCWGGGSFIYLFFIFFFFFSLC